MKSEEYKDSEIFELQLDSEIVAWATWFGLSFPIIFLWCNQNKIPQADSLLPFYVSLLILTFLPYMLSTGRIFTQVPVKWPKWIRRGLYIWGGILLSLVAALVYCTGGIQSSIFNWLFEYALIVTVIVGPFRPRREKTLFRLWRPVLFTGVVEIIIIGMLVLLGEHSNSIPDTINNLMPIWGGLSVFFSLIVSVFLFWISIKKFGGRNKNV